MLFHAISENQSSIWMIQEQNNWSGYFCPVLQILSFDFDFDLVFRLRRNVATSRLHLRFEKAPGSFNAVDDLDFQHQSPIYPSVAN